MPLERYNFQTESELIIYDGSGPVLEPVAASFSRRLQPFIRAEATTLLLSISDHKEEKIKKALAS